MDSEGKKWKEILRKAMMVEKRLQHSDIPYCVLVELIGYIMNCMSINNKEYFIKFSLLKTKKAVQQVSFILYGYSQCCS